MLLIDGLPTNPVIIGTALATLIVAVLLAVLLLPSKTQQKELQKAASTSASRPDAGLVSACSSESSGAVLRGGPAAESGGTSRVVREVKGSAAKAPTKTSEVGAGGVAASADATPSSFSTQWTDLWLLRALAVRRLVDKNVSQDSEGEAKTAISVRRAIWQFLDDRQRLVATGGSDGQARVFDLQTGRMLVSVRHNVTERMAIASLLLSPGPTLITGTWDGRWHGWDSWPRNPTRPSELVRGDPKVGLGNKVVGLALSRDGLLACCACLSGAVLVYRAECPTVEVEVTDADDIELLRASLKIGENSELYMLEDIEIGGTKLYENDELLIEASFSGKCSRRDLCSLELPAQLRFRFVGCLTRGRRRPWRRLEHDGAVHGLAISTELGGAEFVYSASRDKTIRKWAIMSGECVHIYTGHTAMVRCVTVNACFVVSGSDDRTVRVWRRDAPNQLRTLSGHTDFVHAVSLCVTFAHRLVSAGEDRKVILWNAETGDRLREYQHDSIVAAVQLSESVLFTAGNDKFLRIWRTETGKLECKLRHPCDVTALSVL